MERGRCSRVLGRRLEAHHLPLLWGEDRIGRLLLQLRKVDKNMTWDELKVKYKDAPYREDMTEEQEKEFVADCFNCYEQEGFSKVFWCQGGDYPEYVGKPFTVVGRTPIYDGATQLAADLESLPMWNIRFKDGYEMSAYPEEIIPREMRDNGCPEEYLQ